MSHIVIAVTIFLSVLIKNGYAGVPLSRYEALMKQQSNELGLYNASDKVIILSSSNFADFVINKNHSSFVEFYNSYCGHCKRFAPHYKELAEQLLPWRDVMPVCAIDCAAEENNDICREYEVMAYPTLRYFGPGYSTSPKNYGISVVSQNLDTIRNQLAIFLAAENRTTNMSNWPNLQPLTENETPSLFDTLSSQKQYVILVSEPDNSTLGILTILQLLQWPNVQVRRVNDPEISAKYQLNNGKNKIAVVDRRGAITQLAPPADNYNDYSNTIIEFLKTKHITERPTVAEEESSTLASVSDKEHGDQVVLAEVKRNKHFVYYADLEMAIRSILHNEIPKVSNISGERLVALQRFLIVLQRYNPLGPNGRNLVDKLTEYVLKFNEKLSGKDFEDELRRLESELSPIFSANRFIGCSGSKPGYRGFTCSLWKLFHFLTVQAATKEISKDPLEVLQAMHGIVKYFFGCTDCAEHFQAMASRRKIFNVPNQDEAILWLWAAHNEVNQRLAGDSTEDPEFPKIQFPSQSSCSQCYKDSSSQTKNLNIDWNKDEVLSFLKNIYNPEYISHFGIDEGDSLYPSVEKLRRKRLIENVLSDMDMRMGMLLYGFCIVMMVIAFKLFAYKGYRKKPYGHDLLGKV